MSAHVLFSHSTKMNLTPEKQQLYGPNANSANSKSTYLVLTPRSSPVAIRGPSGGRTNLLKCLTELSLLKSVITFWEFRPGPEQDKEQA